MTIIKRNGRTTQIPTSLEDFLSRDVFNWGIGYPNSGKNIPAVNIKESQENFEVEIAAPGMKKEDFKIELDGYSLTISCEKQDQKEDNNDENYSRKEFDYGSFSRTFQLPKEMVNADKIEAKYESGLLLLTIPKREEAKVKPARLINVQ